MAAGGLAGEALECSQRPDAAHLVRGGVGVVAEVTAVDVAESFVEVGGRELACSDVAEKGGQVRARLVLSLRVLRFVSVCSRHRFGILIAAGAS